MKAHQLYKQIPAMYAQVAIDSPGNLVAAVTGSGWEYHPLTANGQTYQAFVNRQYIDLAGWSAEELTMFTVGVDIQKNGTPMVITVPCPLITVYDFLTTRKLSDVEIAALPGTTPSFQDSTLDLMQCIYGERQSLAQNAQIPGTFINVDGGTIGSGNPSAQDKLHWTRIIVTYMASGEAVDGSLSINPTNLLVQATTDKEKDLVWMERLRRSYVLQDQADI